MNIHQKHKELTELFEKFKSDVKELVSPEENLIIRTYIHNVPGKFFTNEAEIIGKDRKLLMQDLSDRLSLVSNNIE